MKIKDLVYYNYVLDIGFDVIYLNEFSSKSNKVDIPKKFALENISFNASHDMGPIEDPATKDDTVFLLSNDEWAYEYCDILPSRNVWALLRNDDETDDHCFEYCLGDMLKCNVIDTDIVIFPVQKIPDLFINKIPDIDIDDIYWKDKLGNDWYCIDKRRGLFVLNNANTTGSYNRGIPYFKTRGRLSYPYRASTARKWIKEHLSDFHLDLIPDEVDYLYVG